MAVSIFNSQGWETTNSYTYRPANITPKYTGYIPEQRYQFGDTFGNTNQLLLYKRPTSTVVQTDRYNLYKHSKDFARNPKLAFAHKISREKWLAAQRYKRTDEGTPEKDMENFLQNCQKHREHYQDLTGRRKRVDEFILPKLTMAIPKTNDTYDILDLKKQHEKVQEFNPVAVSDYIRRCNDQKQTKFRGTCRQRAIRDQVFENR